MVETSENTEASIVLVSVVASGLTGFLAAAPIPLEWKNPLITLTLTVTGAVLVYWKTQVNKKKN